MEMIFTSLDSPRWGLSSEMHHYGVLVLICEETHENVNVSRMITKNKVPLPQTTSDLKTNDTVGFLCIEG